MEINSKPRIFILIPSYRDPQTQWTVKDLFEKAEFPARVFVGICWQYDKEKDTHCFLEPYVYPDNVRVKEFSYLESQGTGWARNQAFSLAQDEEYTLQIDAHMRFEKGWDEILIDMLQKCPGNKKILSHYPPSFILPDKYATDSVPYLYPGRMNETGLPMEQSFAINIKDAPDRPILNYSVAAGMIFAPTTFFRELPIDPHIYFWGDQISTAVRAWTHGWNIYSPNKNSVYHIYHETGLRPLNWHDNPDWVEKAKKTTARMQYLLRIIDSVPDEYAEDSHLLELGQERHLIEYEQLSGVRFREKQLLPQVIPQAIHRLVDAGANIQESTREWYHSLFLINQIKWDTNDERVSTLFQSYLMNSSGKESSYSVRLHFSQRCLDSRRFSDAENYAFEAMRSDLTKPNAYSMVARIFMRQGRYDQAHALLNTAQLLCSNNIFTVLLHQEPHPLTLLAVNYCKRLMPDEASRAASEAMGKDAFHTAALQAIMDNPENPIGKEFWLFPDKKANFEEYQKKDEISQDWIDWATNSIANGVAKKIIRYRVEDAGFQKVLIDELFNRIG